MIAVDQTVLDRVCQGDILREIEYCESAVSVDGIIEINKIVFPTVVVLTQDCDLESDEECRVQEKPSDKWLISVLLAPAYNSEHFFTGGHLEYLGVQSEMFKKGKTDYNRIVQNKNPRYHFLEFPPDSQLPPASVVDFKHYFSAHVPYLRAMKGKNHVCKLGGLFREDVSQRFSSYLSRIGLPSWNNHKLNAQPL